VWVLIGPGSTSRRTAAPPTNATLDRTFILFQRFPREVSGNEVLTKWTPEAAAAYARAVIEQRGLTKPLSLVKE